MKPLTEIIKGIDIFEQVGSAGMEVSKIVFDTRGEMPEGSVFFAVSGSKVDGHDHIDIAVSSGAVAVVCEKMPANTTKGVTYLRVENTKKALSLAAQNFYDNPSLALKVVGVTGTNGKTTIATMLHNIHTLCGGKSVLISTVECIVVDKVYPATHTTPDPMALAWLMDQGVKNGATHVFMEVSSHALSQDRVYGIPFELAVFTNLTHDHLDYHKTFENYRDAKKILFDGLSRNSFAVINLDDANSEYMVSASSSKKIRISGEKDADYMYKIISTSMDGMKILVNDTELDTKLVGKYNAENIVEVYAASISLSIPKERLLQAISQLPAPKGRLEIIKSPKGVFGVVDYAHTPDALENVLRTLNQTKGEEASIIAVVGCGGDRDKTKRPIMGKIAIEGANMSIFTSDNPRSEDPESIIDEMLVGNESHVYKYERVSDRHQAISRAVSLAKEGDIVLVAGKGHEDYQEIKGVKHHFSDQEELKKLFGI